jgi:hypothetical protein
MRSALRRSSNASIKGCESRSASSRQARCPKLDADAAEQRLHLRRVAQVALRIRRVAVDFCVASAALLRGLCFGRWSRPTNEATIDSAGAIHFRPSSRVRRRAVRQPTRTGRRAGHRPITEFTQPAILQA